MVIKATDSDFWQYLAVGANNYAKEHPDVKVTVYGAPSETDVIAKWLSVAPDVLNFDEPTIGVDVGSRAEIYGLIRDLALKGCGIVVVSSCLPEVLELADRVIVMHEGRQTGTCGRDEATEERLLSMASKIVASAISPAEQDSP